MEGTIIQVSVSGGGIPKRAVPQAYAASTGLEGDACAHPRIHGGPKQAILIITVGSLAELGEIGFVLSPGSLGENLTVDGLDARRFETGTRFRAGDAVLELTKPRSPCRTLPGRCGCRCRW